MRRRRRAASRRVRAIRGSARDDDRFADHEISSRTIACCFAPSPSALRGAVNAPGNRIASAISAPQRRRAAEHRVAAPQPVIGEEIVDPAARLLDQQQPGQRIPRIHVQFAIAVGAAVRHVGEPERARSAAAHLRAGPDEVADHRDIGIGRPPRRPAGLDQRRCTSSRPVTDIGRPFSVAPPPRRPAYSSSVDG